MKELERHQASGPHGFFSLWQSSSLPQHLFNFNAFWPLVPSPHSLGIYPSAPCFTYTEGLGLTFLWALQFMKVTPKASSQHLCRRLPPQRFTLTTENLFSHPVSRKPLGCGPAQPLACTRPTPSFPVKLKLSGVRTPQSRPQAEPGAHGA